MKTVTKQEEQKEWAKTIKEALKSSIADSVEEGQKEEEKENDNEGYGVSIANGTNSVAMGNIAIGSDTTLASGTAHTLMVASDSGTISYLDNTGQYIRMGGNDAPATYTQEWMPVSNITTYELAMAIPYITGAKFFFEGDPELNYSFVRHFKLTK